MWIEIIEALHVKSRTYLYFNDFSSVLQIKFLFAEFSKSRVGHST